MMMMSIDANSRKLRDVGVRICNTVLIADVSEPGGPGGRAPYFFGQGPSVVCAPSLFVRFKFYVLSEHVYGLINIAKWSVKSM